jgi:hypothetical protein
MLGGYKPFAYLLSYVSIMGLLAFLMFRGKLRWFNGVLSGLFFLGSAISLVVGIIILPLSLIGLIILVGALGFTPLFSAFVYYRNAVRAYKLAKGSMTVKYLRHSLALSAILSFSLPFFFNVKVKQEIDLMLSGDAQTIEAAGKRLAYVAPLVNVERLAKRYDGRGNTAELNQAIEKTYLSLTGEDVKEAKRRLSD